MVASRTAPLSYQWQRDGTNSSGATSSSYTTPATTTADKGATFAVVVSNSAGSVTSNSALTLRPGTSKSYSTSFRNQTSNIHEDAELRLRTTITTHSITG